MEPDLNPEAGQRFNGGIIFVSYVISVLGAMTTLELLLRRTHFTGVYNWFLLTAAAFSMGGVGIWSMHFIGNNSLELLANGTAYHLSYTAGYTFASLVVAIACMFIAFAFVGVTEKAQLKRLIPGGTVAGIGIAVMHYIGQFAIEFFVLSYKPAFVIAAVVIACAAVNAALYIFFKLREHWTTQWYKRLGCAMLMAIAVCGMHYTAMAGTKYRVPQTAVPPPSPRVNSAVIIGIISGIVVIACSILLYVSVRGGLRRLPIVHASESKRLVLCVIFFSKNGMILVDVQGVVPGRQVLVGPIPGQKDFSNTHPLFHRLLLGTIRWSKHAPIHNQQPPQLSDTQTPETDDHVEQLFLNAANEIAQELKVNTLADLGILHDSLVESNTMASTESDWAGHPKQKRKKGWLLWPSKKGHDQEDWEAESESSHKHKSHSTSRHLPSFTTSVTSTVMPFVGDGVEVPNVHHDYFIQSSFESARQSQSEKSVTKDLYMFLVREIDNKEMRRLLSIGYRFADPLFISRTMGVHLRIPSEHMLSHFADMQHSAQAVTTLLKTKPPTANPGQFSAPSISDSISASTSSSGDVRIDDAVRGAVYVGHWVLFREDTEHTETPVFHMMVDKMHRNRFPMVQLRYSNGEAPDRLDDLEKSCIFGLQDQSLLSIGTREPSQHQQYLGGASTTDNTVKPSAVSHGSADLPPHAANSFMFPQHHRFLHALKNAANELMNHSSYGKPLGTIAALSKDVIDIPPLALTVGPCQLILFRAVVTIPGSAAAINQLLSEPIKCTPLDIYRTLASHITDQAVQVYRKTYMGTTPENYIHQGQMYHSTTSLSLSNPSSSVLQTRDAHATAQGQSGFLANFSSLPPPPRAKRPKTVTTTASQRPGPHDKTHGAAPTKPMELPVMLTILPTQERFSWLDNLIDETLYRD